MRFLAAFTCAWLVLCLGVLPGHADKRVALVIGNGAYKKVPQLPNPVNDAAAIAVLLSRAGFDVVQSKTNLDLASMRRALRDFADAARDADAAVVFYAGHGIEVSGVNYLIPVDAMLDRDLDVEDESISLDRVNQMTEPAKRLRLIILDACRDNPFALSMKRTIANRSIGRGLARVDVMTADTLIAFAAKAGSTAVDGIGANSPYTAALLQHLTTPGLDLRLALGRVRDQVRVSTGGKQEPFVYGSLGGAEISLVPGADGRPSAAVAPSAPMSAPPAPTVSPPSAAEAWAVTKDTTSPAVLQDFIRQFGKTSYGSMARARLKELQAATTKPPDKVAVVAAPGAPPASMSPNASVSLSVTGEWGPFDPECNWWQKNFGGELRLHLTEKDGLLSGAVIYDTGRRFSINGTVQGNKFSFNEADGADTWAGTITSVDTIQGTRGHCKFVAKKK